MGGKQSWRGQRIYICAALLTCLCIAVTNCASPLMEAPSRQKEDTQQHLLAAKSHLVRGSYEASLREYEKVLSLSPRKPPADEALFNMGLIYADSGNANKAYSKSIVLFKRLISNFPQSAYAHQARMWAEVLQEDIRLRQTVTETLRENERLRKVLEESKKIDIEMGDKIRRKAR